MALCNFSTSSLSLTNTDASHIHDPYIANFSVFEAVHQFRGDGGSLRCVLPRPQLHLSGNLQLAAVILVVPLHSFTSQYHFYCRYQGILSQNQMEALTDKQLMEKHRTFRLNTGKCPVIFLSSFLTSQMSAVCTLSGSYLQSPADGC